MRSSNHRSSLAVLSGLLAIAAVPVAVLISRQTTGVRLLDAVWAIPVAALFGIAALLFARGARGRIRRTLEDEHFEVLPTGTYIKGFLRSYAEFLGLDGQLYVDEYNSRNVVDSFDDMPQRRPVRRHDRSVEKRVVVLALAGIAALTGLVIVAWRFGGGSSATPPAIVTQQRPAAPSGLRFVGLGKGTYLEVRRRSAAGHMVFH